MFSFYDVLADGVRSGASDIHIGAGSLPILRIDGRLVSRPGAQSVTPEDMDGIVHTMLSPEQIIEFTSDREFDFSFNLRLNKDRDQRMRANLSYSKGVPVLSIRIILPNIRTIKELGLPIEVKNVAARNNGIFLVTGPTGSGKSTTLAAIIQEINVTRQVHIVTIEDPIEYIFTSERALIHQREVGGDTKTFAEALRRAMRQDPDVIMIGELRDLETISAAVTAAETGHLVLATLHTPDAPQSIDRIIDVFPPHQQQQIRVQLSSILIGILSQQLVPMASGSGRIIATELMIANNAVRNHIRESKTAQIKNTIQTNSASGMHLMEQDLARLCKEGVITRNSAISYANDIKDIERFLGE